MRSARDVASSLFREGKSRAALGVAICALSISKFAPDLEAHAARHPQIAVNTAPATIPFPAGTSAAPVDTSPEEQSYATDLIQKLATAQDEDERAELLARLRAIREKRMERGFMRSLTGGAVDGGQLL